MEVDFLRYSSRQMYRVTEHNCARAKWWIHHFVRQSRLRVQPGEDRQQSIRFVSCFFSILVDYWIAGDLNCPLVETSYGPRLLHSLSCPGLNTQPWRIPIYTKGPAPYECTNKTKECSCFWPHSGSFWTYQLNGYHQLFWHQIGPLGIKEALLASK